MIHDEFPPRPRLDPGEPLLGEKLNPLRAAELLGIKPGTLKQWRSRKTGPRYLKYGTSIVYLRTDLLAYMRESLIEP